MSFSQGWNSHVKVWILYNFDMENSGIVPLNFWNVFLIFRSLILYGLAFKV